MVLTYAAPIAANQFFQGLFYRQEASNWHGQTALRLPMVAEAATEKLLKIMRTLCAPDSGWPEDKPQTPENLLPYVADEAEELLETLQVWASGCCTAAPMPGTNSNPEVRGNLKLFSELSAYFLWAIAASTPAAMKLLEGISTQLSCQAASHGVRLVPVLQVHCDHADYALDLATQTYFDPQIVLSETAVLQLPDQDVAAMSLAQWQQRIWQGAIAIAPELRQWQRGTAIQLLLPGQAWTTASALLWLKFVPLTVAVGGISTKPDEDTWKYDTTLNLDDMGIPNARVWQAEVDERTTLVDADIVANAPNGLSHRFSLEADVAFEDIAGLQAAIAPLAIDQVRQRFQLSSGTTDLSPLELVEAVYTVIHPEKSLEPLPLRSPLTLAELCQQVKWLWIRASQDLMPLMAGVTARRLAARQPWDVGTVVTVGQLVIQDQTEKAILDVTSGAWEMGETPLDTGEILHLQTPTRLPQTLWRGEDLAAYCNDWVRQRSPLLAHLMPGIPAKLTSPHDALFPDIADEPLTLRFQIAINFLP